MNWCGRCDCQFCSGVIDSPGTPWSMRNIVIPPRAFFSGSVTASSRKKLALSASEMNVFDPLMTHSSPSSTARVFMFAGSEPASGSVCA